MTGGGFAVPEDPSLWHVVTEVFIDLGAHVFARDSPSRGTATYEPGDRWFRMYAAVYPGTEWELREGPFVAAPGVRIPDMDTVTGCPYECRWADLTAEMFALMARRATFPIWLLDGDGVVWDADAVDPERMRL